MYVYMYFPLNSNVILHCKSAYRPTLTPKHQQIIAVRILVVHRERCVSLASDSDWIRQVQLPFVMDCKLGWCVWTGK